MLSPWFYAAKTLYCLVADYSDLRLTFLVGSYCLGTVFPQTIDTGSLTTGIMHISIYNSCTQSSKGEVPDAEPAEGDQHQACSQTENFLRGVCSYKIEERER